MTLTSGASGFLNAYKGNKIALKKLAAHIASQYGSVLVHRTHVFLAARRIEREAARAGPSAPDPGREPTNIDGGVR